MTPDQINRAIAEHLGWTESSMGSWVNPDGFFGDPPNYSGDLNAMREAEMTLESVAPTAGVPCRSLYLRELHVLVGAFMWQFATATAAQRAEAFLRTVGKWKE